MARREPERLFHYTCLHAAPLIDADGYLRPWPDAEARRHPGLAGWPLPVGLVWLTDLDTPLRDALGLTTETIGCDRTRFRFTVIDLTHCQPWTAYARDLPRHARLRLETVAPGLLPAHWWVSLSVVPVTGCGELLTGSAQAAGTGR